MFDKRQWMHQAITAENLIEKLDTIDYTIDMFSIFLLVKILDLSLCLNQIKQSRLCNLTHQQLYLKFRI